MAFAAVGTFGSANDKSAGTTIVFTASATVEVGNLAVVWSAWDNSQTTDGDSTQLSLADSAGNTWTKLYEKTESSGAADDGVALACWISVVTTQITSGSSTVTVTSTSSRTASAIFGYEFTKGASTTVSLANGTAIASSQAGSGQPGSITTTGMTNEAHLHLYALGAEGTQGVTGYDTLTDAGNAGTTGGVGDTNINLEPAYAIGTGTSLACDVTLSSGTQWIQVLAAVREVASGQTVAAGLNSETDTAQTITRVKAKATGLNSETDSALAATVRRTRAVGLNTETDTALAITAALTPAAGSGAGRRLLMGVGA